MKRNKDFNDLHFGIDTLEITTSSKIQKGEFEFFTHITDTRAINTSKGTQFRYRCNPNKLNKDNGDIYSFSKYQKAMEWIYNAAKLEEPKITRIDFKFDMFESKYDNYFKLNQLVVGMIQEKLSLSNRWSSIDFITLDKKTIAVKGRYREVEFYNKQLQEPHGDILCRLEVRNKSLEFSPDEGIELRLINDWVEHLKDICNDRKWINKVTRNQNIYLCKKYEKESVEGTINTADEFVTKYADYFYTSRQMTDFFDRIGYKSGKSKTHTYRKKHKIEFFSLNEVKEYIYSLVNAVEQYTQTQTKENMKQYAS